MRPRDEHLAWCKTRALEILDAGDREGAVASMLSDLNKWREPLYSAAVMAVLALDGMMTRRTVADVRNWIEGFQ